MFSTWSELARRARPGSGTQRAQWCEQATQEVSTWLVQMGRVTKYARSSAFSAIVGLPPHASYEQVVTLAKLIAWIFEIDRFLDDPVNSNFAQLKDQCDALVAPVRIRGDQQRPTRVGGAMAESTAALQEMLEHVLDACTRLWQAPAESQSHLYDQVERLVDTMRYEAEMRIGVRHCSTLEDYLAQAQYSIGLPLVSYAVAGFFDSCDAWLRENALVLHAACCLRLMNDLATARTEAAAGKKSSLAFVGSADAIRQLALQEGEYVRNRAIPETREALPSFLLFTAAFAITHYEQGTFVQLD